MTHSTRYSHYKIVVLKFQTGIFSVAIPRGILPALVCLVMATETNLLLAQAGESRN